MCVITPQMCVWPEELAYEGEYFQGRQGALG